MNNYDELEYTIDIEEYLAQGLDERREGFKGKDYSKIGRIERIKALMSKGRPLTLDESRELFQDDIVSEDEPLLELIEAGKAKEAFHPVELAENLRNIKRRIVSFKCIDRQNHNREALYFTEVVGDGKIEDLLLSKIKYLCELGWINQKYQDVRCLRLNYFEQDTISLEYMVNCNRYCVYEFTDINEIAQCKVPM